MLSQVFLAAVLAATAIAYPASAEEPKTSATKVAVTGYVESFYQWNFNNPSNRLTNFRGFDNRHNSFTISNAVLDTQSTAGPVSARLALQVGHTPETYYLPEPSSPGSSSAGTTNASTWKFLQQANIGYRAPFGRGLLIEAGIFLSPIGPESFPIKDNAHWSRSNLFFGLPFYHTGARVSYMPADRITLILMGSNGWNSVVDNNSGKSVAAELLYTIAGHLAAHVLYFGGVEHPTGVLEGSPWRHLFDAYATWKARPWLSGYLHGNAGLERNRFGTSHWQAGALSARVHALDWLAFAARGDVFFEHVAKNAAGTASPIFWLSDWVASQTVTAELKPGDVSIRLEYRHDQAAGATFFRDAVAIDAMGAFVPNALSQDTVTAGMVAWF